MDANFAYEIVALGRVQGVAFRHYTCLKAKELNILGSVKNQSDGSVIVKATGEKVKLIDFIDWLRTGSPASRVDALHYSEIENFEASDFKIIR